MTTIPEQSSRRLLPDEQPLPVDGLPPGLVAYPRRIRRPDEHHVDGKTVRDFLLASNPDQHPPSSAPLEQLTPAQQRFVLGARSRTRSAILNRFAAQAETITLELAQAGIVALIHYRRADHATALGTLCSWQLTPYGHILAQQHHHRQHHHCQHTRRRAARLADHLDEHTDTGLESLTRLLRDTDTVATHGPLLQATGEALLAGERYSSERAFVQHRFTDTKHLRADSILAELGVDEHLRIQLGIRRSGELGFSGPIQLTAGSGTADLAGFTGPVLFPTVGLYATLLTQQSIVIVENKQAAAALSRQRPDLAVIYTAGLMGPDSRRVLTEALPLNTPVSALCDADLGGLRISEQILHIAPSSHIVDIGSFPHPPRTPWPEHSYSHIQLTALATSNPHITTETDDWFWTGPQALPHFAQRLLNRGYPVEQELAVVTAINHLHPYQHRI